ncbi:MAG: cellulase family glycosylhydrolase [Verrucomicrobiota bacterium]
MLRSPFALLLALACYATAAPLPDAGPAKLPRWRGFNLLEKFQFAGKHEPFHEDDFRLIAKLGFNFVRLPMDYRGYIVDGDWNRFDEAALVQIDQAITWGRQYGIHVCLNLHRAPGWTVAKPAETKNLWTDPDARQAAARHWAMFARRYKGVSNNILSFNLFNEPAGVAADAYVAVVKEVVAAIRAEDPQRLVLCDGLEWGTLPVPELIPLKVAMMTRGYSPFQLTHYKASWAQGSGASPVPCWPDVGGTGGTLISPAKGALSRPLQISGSLAAGSTVRLVATTLSSRAVLTVSDTTGEELWRKELSAGPDKGPWRKNALDPRWNCWQAEGEVEFSITLAHPVKGLTLRVVDGDWLTLNLLGIRAAGGAAEAVARLTPSWDQVPETLSYNAADPANPLLGVPHGRDWLRAQTLPPWQAFAAAGGGVMVGEWGAYQFTPHPVVLRWAEDCLHNWQDVGWGWALWNFRGSFGILDSGRKDVTYEAFEGHQLDRKYLELLQRY